MTSVFLASAFVSKNLLESVIGTAFVVVTSVVVHGSSVSALPICDEIEFFVVFGCKVLLANSHFSSIW